MKRPLLVAGLAVAVIAAVRLKAGGPDALWGQPETAYPASGENVVITGQVCQKDEKTFSVKSVILYQTNQEAAISQQRIPFRKKIVCEVTDTGVVTLGGTVALKGTFEAYSAASNPGEFDSAAYYRSIGVIGKLRKAEILSQKQPFLCIREKLYRLKCYWKERLYSIFPDEQAAIMCALLLGDKSELDGGLKELYRRNGILHILSISSLHITILGMGLYRLLRRFGAPVWVAALAGCLFMAAYGVMTGLGVSVCRAIGMYLLRMLAETVGRTYEMLNILGAVGAGMLMYNPHYLENSGFWLSYGAILGIGILYPALQTMDSGRDVPVLYGESRIRKLTRHFMTKGREGLLLSLSVTLATLPVQLWFYYEIPAYSILMNLLVLPFVKPLLIVGFTALILPFGEALSGVDCLILEWYERLCEFFDRLPFVVWNPGKPSVWQMVVYYGLLAVLVWRCGRESREEAEGGKRVELVKRMKLLKRAKREDEERKLLTPERAEKERDRKGKLTTLGGICFGIIILAIRPPARNQVFFLNVGQGDCSIVRTASGETYLFDCGSSSRSSVGKYVLLPFLKYYGIHTIDGILLSHPDADHVNGAVEFLSLADENRISIKQVVLPDAGTQGKDEMAELLRKIEAIQTEELLQKVEQIQTEELPKKVEQIQTEELPKKVEQIQTEELIKKVEQIQTEELIKKVELIHTEGMVQKAKETNEIVSGNNTYKDGTVEVRYLAAGDRWKCDAAEFLCLHPVPGGIGGESANEYSLCVYAVFGEEEQPEMTVLFTGDVEGEGEKELVEELRRYGICDVTLLKTAHHGSRNSTSEELLEQIRPCVAVISCGENNRYGHPHAETVERLKEAGCRIFMTSEYGAISAESGIYEGEIVMNTCER